MNTLHTYPKAPRSLKGIIAAKYSETPLHVTNQNEFQMGITNKSPEFLSKFPLGKVPALETAEGHCITESVAIAYYLSSAELKGSSPLDSAHVMQWVLFSENELVPHLMTWLLPCLGLLPFNKKETEKAKEELKRLLGLLDTYLSTRTYLVGHCVTLADICLMCNLLTAFSMVFDPEYRAPFVNVCRWFETMVNQPNIRPVVGDVEMCAKMAQFDSKKYNELHPSEKKAKTKEQPKQAPQPEEVVDPLKKAPRGDKFNLEEFKREYLNVIKRKESQGERVEALMDYLNTHFDDQLYSLYQCHYNFPEELAKEAFKIKNLITNGFHKMTDSLSKYYFGLVQIYHSPEAAQIHGFFFFLGQDVPFSLYPDFEDFCTELYSWKKLQVGEVKPVLERFLGKSVDPNTPFFSEVEFT